MKKEKLLSKPECNADEPNFNRRKFLWRAGAVVTAAMAASVPVLAAKKDDEKDGLMGKISKLTRKIGLFEDTDSVRKLYQEYESKLDKGMYEEIVNLFTKDAEVRYNGGVFTGTKDISRLYHEQFAQGLTGKKVEMPQNLQPVSGHDDAVKVAKDRKSAEAKFAFAMQAGTPMDSGSMLVQMARLQGQGVHKWREGGVCEVSFVKENKSWKIRKIDYKTMWQSELAPGQAYAKEISMPVLA